PPLKKTKELAELFNIDIDDLTGIDLELPNIKKNKAAKGFTINVLGHVAAGIPLEAIEEIIDTEEISEEMASTGEFFGLQIHGDSMEPRMCEGDVVIVRKQDDAESGDIVIALVNGNDATCKRLMKYSGGISLIALNSKYEPLMFSNEDIQKKPVRILGKVVELRGKL
ncbi:MAG: repressor LexA, partial [Lachnospiraceae bacterium]|nr:repressor LexA [Lachnospiraceae bacterium]